jgi:hypothetical protein
MLCAAGAADSMRVPQRPQNVPPAAIWLPQDGQFIEFALSVVGQASGPLNKYRWLRKQ